MMLINNVYAAETTTSSESRLDHHETWQSNLISFVPMILIFAVFYFLLIRPQEKKRKEHERLISLAQKGQDVVTHSGIYGRIEKINQDNSSVELEIAKNVVIKITKNSIAEIVNKK
jgi:preprotein translocase subunit YajC